MNLILPLAGRGKRLLPLTLTTAKPLLPLAGQPVIVHLVQALARALTTPIQRIGFVVQGLTRTDQATLTQLAETVGAKAYYYTQAQALGTAHAVHCAASLLQGPTMVALGDMLVAGKFDLTPPYDGLIWTHTVSNPSNFGVVQCDKQGRITACIEKPEKQISQQAIVGLYYFKAGEHLLHALQTILSQPPQCGEHGLTTALSYMLQQKLTLGTQTLPTWLDCGRPAHMLKAQAYVLEQLDPASRVHPTAKLDKVQFHGPCYIGPNAQLQHVTLGPNVSIGAHSHITHATLAHCSLQNHVHVHHASLQYALLGQHARYEHRPSTPAPTLISDYSSVNLSTVHIPNSRE